MSVSSYFKSAPVVAAASVIGVAIVVAALVASYAAYAIKASSDIVEVTGSAKVAVQADYARWTINLDTKTGLTNQQTGYDRLDAATTKILAYLAAEGFTDVETPAASIVPSFTYPQYGEPIQTGYQVTRSIIVRSENIEAIQVLTNNIAPLVGPDYNVSTYGLELTYQKLPETRVALLTDAITDAKARAEAIAKETGRSVSTLRSATGGVVQVLPAGGVDVSDYGMYDTQSVAKEVMVTVRTTFTLE